MTSPPRHVIFGTGAIGLATLDALIRRGETIRMVNRSGTARVPDDVNGELWIGGIAAHNLNVIRYSGGAGAVDHPYRLAAADQGIDCLLYTSPSPRDRS